ncbi:adenosylmethionine decarboxylase [Alloalcanivorax xenomutans]|jgi:S-adenosylmethionine decarboxylase|uniref:S-adenosylmethionine decarboxylase proenzyme n=1 Tax=Alloalcanivorax xenomutans TaxID=1094342 RepID=A0A9Q3W788_9GAMM|nr:adenosylmethionine decarboxylase [Alloalcanivorax xenomutans]MCE7509602.1 adenosylmethionine decarboxylase [Alloalcanivorax xenomutans]
MSLNNGLFQLGIDLQRGSSNTQAEVQAEVIEFKAPHGEVTADSSSDERKDFFIVKDGEKYAGTHLIIELAGAKFLDSIEKIDAAMRECVEKAGATLLHIHLHHFTPNGGVSGVAVLSESHISIHTWPEADYAALDVFMCGDARPHECVEVLRAHFEPTDVVVDELRRGKGLV